jgi:hypothetical protein
MNQEFNPRPTEPRCSRKVLLVSGAGLATAAIIEACGGGGKLTSQPGNPAVPLGPDTASTTFPLLPTAATHPLPAVGAFSGNITVPGVAAAPPGAMLTIVDSIKAPAGAPAFQGHVRRPQSGILSVLFFIQVTASATVTLPSLPQITITVPPSFITPGAQFFYAVSDPTVTGVAVQFRTEGPATVSGTTLTFAASSDPLQVTAGLKYIIAVYSVTSGTQTIENRLAAVGSSPDAVALRNLIAGLVTDPAVPAFATEILQSASASLTTFQRSLLKSVSIATRDPAILTALLSHTPLSAAQSQSLQSVRNDLGNNAAVRQLLSTANQLKQQAPTLAAYVSQAVQSATNPPSPTALPTTLGDSPLDALVRHVFDVIVSSIAFRNVVAAAGPLLQSSDFVPYLQTLPPEVVANFIPPPVEIVLQLPDGVDPLTLDQIKAGLEILGVITGVAVYVLTLPASAVITTTIVVTDVLVGVGAGAGLGVGIIDLATASRPSPSVSPSVSPSP